MIKLKDSLYILLLVVMGGMSSCSRDDVASVAQVTMTMNITSELPDIKVTAGKYTFKNVNTGIESVVDVGSDAELTYGLYNVTFVGFGQYIATDRTVEANVQGVLQNVQVTTESCVLSIPVFVQNSSDDFVIAEIFGVGTYTPENKQYNGDQYIRIYNNTDHTLYADGLVLMESKFYTTQQYDYTPDIMSEAFATQVVAMVPGSGSEHPIEPGESLLLCDNAINHKEANVNSFDLSNADFEWYTQSTSSAHPDVDNPDVPNLDMLYNYTLSIWILNKQGNRAYAIGRIPQNITATQYLQDYVYKYTYTMVTGATSKVQTCYRFPNNWIIDAVNLGPVNGYVWNVTDPSLDMGHTYFGVNSTIAENIGKSVIRKVSYQIDGRDVLQDTNNSTLDFTPSAKGTLNK